MRKVSVEDLIMSIEKVSSLRVVTQVRGVLFDLKCRGGMTTMEYLKVNAALLRAEKRIMDKSHEDGEGKYGHLRVVK